MRTVYPKKNSVFYPDVAQSAWGVLCARIARECAAKITFAVLDSPAECEFFYAKLKYFLGLESGEFDVRILPDPSSGADSDAARFDALCDRVGTLRAIANAGAGNVRLFVVATAGAIFAPAPNPQAGSTFEISRGQKISPLKVRETLANLGYYNETLCEAPGQFAVRGGIIDIYPISADSPVRIDFFGDEIDAVRKFDPNTQLADTKVLSATIEPIPESQSDSSAGSWNACDYLGSEKIDWIFFEPSAILARSPEVFLESETEGVIHRGFGEIFSRGNDSFAAVSSLGTRSDIFENATEKIFPAETLSAVAAISESDGVGEDRFESETQSRIKFAAKLAQWKDEGIDVFIASDGAGDEKLARKIFDEAGKAFSATFVASGFGEGFVVRDFGSMRPDWKILSKNAKGAAFVGSREMFGRRQKSRLEPHRRMLSRRAQVDQLLDFAEL